MKTQRPLLLALCAPLLVLSACGDDGGSADDTTTDAPGTTTTNDPTTTTDDPPGTSTTDDPATTTGEDTTTTDDPDSSSGEPAGMASVRVMHLGVNAPGVDVFANGAGPVFENLEFRNSTAYADVDEGDYTFEVSVTGSGADEAVLAPELTLEADTAYTAVAIGDLNETDGAPGLSAIALVDDAADIAAGDIRITVVHAAPAVGQVDVWEISGDPVPLVENVDYGASATLDDIPASALEIGIDADDDGVPDLTYSVDASPLGGAQLNVFANNDDTGAVALVVQLSDGTVLTVPANE